MIEARELRVGNYIYELKDTPESPDEKELFLVAAINSLTSTLIDVNENITQVEYCEPIPLTPEILEKLGFKTTKLWYRVELTVEDKASVFTAIVDTSLKGAYIEYYDHISALHSFQNLYYYTIGEELEITL